MRLTVRQLSATHSYAVSMRADEAPSGDEVRTRVRDALSEIFAGHEITWTEGG